MAQATPADYAAKYKELAGQNLSEADPPAWVRTLFYSHPPISERIGTVDRRS